MPEISVTIKALNETRNAVEKYARDVADAVTAAKTDPAGIWSDEHRHDYEDSMNLLIQTVIEISNSTMTLSSRLQRKAELVAKNKKFKVW